MVESASLQEQLERWAQRLQNLTVSPLTRDYPDNQKPEQVKRVIEAFESYQLPSEAQLALKKVSGGSSSGFTAFLTAYVVLVARLTGDEDIAIGTNSSDDGRPFVLRVSIDSSDTFLQLYGKVEKVRGDLVYVLRKIETHVSRLSMKDVPILCHWIASGPISRKSRKQNAPRFSSVLRPSRHQQRARNIRRTRLKRPIW